MSEIVTTYKLDDLDQPIPMDRDGFYDSQIKSFKETGKNTHAVAIVQILLFTPDGEIALQKRSMNKSHNPSKMDKTIGGHMRFGDTPNYTVMGESLQELEVPAFVLDSKEDFQKTYRLLNEYTNRSALMQYLDSRTYTSKKIIDKEVINISNKFYLYLGVYNGAIRPADKEAAGVLYYNYDVLKREMKETPELFTYDLTFFINKYDDKIRDFLDYLHI